MNPFKSVKDYYNYKSFVAQETLRLEKDGQNPEDLRVKYKDYSEMNLKRMERSDRTYQPSEEALTQLSKIAENQIWWVITELWCGDSAQTLPIIAKLAEAQSDKIELRIILRDDHVDIMDQYLTNGGRSIPKLIALEESSGKELFTWGPRPKGAQEVMDKAKNNPELSQEDIINQLYVWYPKDKGKSTESEIITLL